MLDMELHADITCSLTELQDELLQFERTQETHDQVAIRESLQLLLRRAHSLKGVLRLGECPESASLIHSVESLLVRHGQAEALVPRRPIDLVFDALDAVAASLELRREDVSRLRGVAFCIDAPESAPAPAQTDARSFPFAVTQSEYDTIVQARARGQRIYCVEKAIRTDLSQDLFENLPIREDLAMTGCLLACRPRFADINRRRAEAIVTFVVATQLSHAELDLVVFDEWAFCRWPEPPPEGNPAPKAASPRLSRAGAAQQRRFLVVEDEPTSQLLLRELLKQHGQCDVASDGADAIAAISEVLASGGHYAAVCLDIMMPGMDGHAVLRQLRGLEVTYRVPTRGRAKVIMTTALSGYDHFHQAFVEECDSYLVKPITRAALERQLRRLGVCP